MRVLIVDDDPIALQLLGNALVRAGHTAVTAANGQEALAILRGGSCNLVISDWEMPEMDGLELCHAIRFADFAGYIYIILLTSHDSAAEKIVGLSAGADDFMAKPFNPAEVEARIRTAERIISMETRDVALFAMAKLAESRDPETGAHLERVQGYSRALAWHLAGREAFRDIIDREYVRLIHSTSPLHDIGKVGIPDQILLKPGKLTEQEFEVMKTHSTIGADTLAAALEKFPGAKFLQMARDIASSHHEWFNGAGYPGKLVGDAIPLCGRIVAVADVYDALTTKRSYKEPFSHEASRAMILKEAGTHFDPAVIEAFVKTEAEFISIRERFAEARVNAA